MYSVKTRAVFGLAAAAFVALTLSTALTSTADAGAPQASTQKVVQLRKQPPVNPRPTGGPAQGAPSNIASKPVFIKDHWWAQFYDVITGENTGCHDHDNGMSCEGTCPCK